MDTSALNRVSAFAKTCEEIKHHFRQLSDIMQERDSIMAKKVPIGFTSTEVKHLAVVDRASGLQAWLSLHGDACDDFLDGDYAVEMICETLTDGSVKKSVRIRPAD